MRSTGEGNEGSRGPVVCFSCATDAFRNGDPIETFPSIEEALERPGTVIVMGDVASIASELRRIGPARARRVVVVCENAGVWGVLELFRAGVKDCFVGAEAMDEALRRVKRDSPVCLADADVSLERSTLTLYIGEERFWLTRTQFAIIEYLFDRRGEWVHANQLIEATLQSHHRQDSSIVRVHVHGIRRALGRWASILETDARRSRGYRLIAGTGRPSTMS